MPRVVLAHGFTQTGESMAPLAALLRRRGIATECPDLPGHGRASTADPDLWAGARELAAVHGRAVYAGYSMGGRYCLHLALQSPESVERLVLIGATPGLERAEERAARRAADEALAASIERDGVNRFLAQWLANPLFATLPAAAAGIEERRANSAAGLAASLRAAGTGAQESLWPRLGELRMPVLVVTGALDTKFSAIARRMADAIPDPHRVEVPDAGHAVHLERPDAVAGAVADFVS